MVVVVTPMLSVAVLPFVSLTATVHEPALTGYTTSVLELEPGAMFAIVVPLLVHVLGAENAPVYPLSLAVTVWYVVELLSMNDRDDGESTICGTGVGVAVGVGVGVGVAVATGVGVAVGAIVGVGVAAGVGIE